MHYVMYVLSELLIRRSRSLGDLAYEEDFSFLKHRDTQSIFIYIIILYLFARRRVELLCTKTYVNVPIYLIIIFFK